MPRIPDFEAHWSAIKIWVGNYEYLGDKSL